MTRTIAYSIVNALLFLVSLSNAVPTVARLSDAPELAASLKRQSSSAYAPFSVACPDTPLVRPADSLSSGESSYVAARESIASGALAAWLSSRGDFDTSSLPVVGFTSSGGGYRSLLTTAGVVQAFDSRDSQTGVSGLYQSLTYQAGLSGGAWFLSSLAANNWPTVTSLRDGLWEQAFQTSTLVPANILATAEAGVLEAVTADIAAKQAAGFNVTVVDPYGRLLSYQLLYGDDGGVMDTLSGLTGLSNFTSYSVPYPIITTRVNFPSRNLCFPRINGPIFEFHPYEYGSWDNGVDAFALTQFAGTAIRNGLPISSDSCIVNYDNIGYIFGTSADVFNGLAGGACFTPPVENVDILGVIEGIIATVEAPDVQDIFGLFPNPFYRYSQSPLVSRRNQLALSDGGEAGQNNPIWPFIQPERNVNVLIVNDNSADTADNFPNGTEIRQTYVNAKRFGLTKMPFIPTAHTFVSKGLNKRAVFFGCDLPDQVLIVFLPNVDYIFASNQPTTKVQYSKRQTNGLIANGVEVGTQNGDENWPLCLACAIASKSESGEELPDGCGDCFDQYCYRR